MTAKPSKENELRRWRMNCFQHELPYGRELQNYVLHCGNITTMTAKPSNHEQHKFSIHGDSQFMKDKVFQIIRK